MYHGQLKAAIPQIFPPSTLKAHQKAWIKRAHRNAQPHTQVEKNHTINQHFELRVLTVIQNIAQQCNSFITHA